MIHPVGKNVVVRLFENPDAIELPSGVRLAVPDPWRDYTAVSYRGTVVATGFDVPSDSMITKGAEVVIPLYIGTEFEEDGRRHKVVRYIDVMGLMEASGMLKPVGDRILVEKTDAPSETAAGILLPETRRTPELRGRCIAAGDAKYEFLVGKEVLFDFRAGYHIIDHTSIENRYKRVVVPVQAVMGYEE